MRGPVPTSPESVVSEANPNGGGEPTPKRRRAPKHPLQAEHDRLIVEAKRDIAVIRETMRRKIAVMGYTDHRKFAPFLNPEWEIWGLNDLYHELPDGLTMDRLRWFQVHAGEWHDQGLRPESPTDFRTGFPHPRDPNYLPWLKEWSGKGMRLYLQSPRPELPNAIIMDREAIFRYFEDGTGTAVKYFTNSISWMLAVAIMELAPLSNGKRALDGAEIGVFGVDMMMGGGPGSEYGYQRPSCEWLLGWAMAAGIKTHIPKESDLLKSAYQYGEEQHEYFRKRLQGYRNEMSKRRGEATSAIENARLAHAELSGAINCADWILRSHLPSDPGEDSPGRVPAPNADKGVPLGLTVPEGDDG